MTFEPDSALALDSRERAIVTLTPAIYNHSVRSYHFGAVLANRLGIAYDAELLYVASLFHDFGFASAAEEDRSFEIVGADIARDAIAHHSPKKAGEAWSAIAAHTVAHMAKALGGVAFLLHVGSAADVFGARLTMLNDIVAEIEHQYPRGTIAQEIRDLTREHSRAHPYGQLAAFRALGLDPR